jgi:hypothetical protein
MVREREETGLRSLSGRENRFGGMAGGYCTVRRSCRVRNWRGGFGDIISRSSVGIDGTCRCGWLGGSVPQVSDVAGRVLSHDAGTVIADDETMSLFVMNQLHICTLGSDAIHAKSAIVYSVYCIFNSP